MLPYSPLQRLQSRQFNQAGLEVYIKRDDLIHPEIMGNKWRKLKYNLEEAAKGSCQILVTLGGAYSNHIAATAAAAREYGFGSVGIIRGDELSAESNPTLRQAAANGMDLRFVSRTHYRKICEDLTTLRQQYPNAYFLPEGGTNALAIAGCAELIDEIDLQFDYLLLPVGTGGTMAGAVKGSKGTGKIVGVSALKGNFVRQSFEHLLLDQQISYANWDISTDYHFGGYGRVTAGLITFIKDFRRQFGIVLDPVYTSKMAFALMDMVEKGFFTAGSKIILLHTGGLQGLAGFSELSSLLDLE